MWSIAIQYSIISMEHMQVVCIKCEQKYFHQNINMDGNCTSNWFPIYFHLSVCYICLSIYLSIPVCVCVCFNHHKYNSWAERLHNIYLMLLFVCLFTLLWQCQRYPREKIPTDVPFTAETMFSTDPMINTTMERCHCVLR